MNENFKPQQYNQNNKQNGDMIWEKNLTVYEYDFLKSYLYAVHTGNFNDENIIVSRCIAHSALNHRPQAVSALDSGSETFKIIPDTVLEATVTWQKEMYEVNISKELIAGNEKLFRVYCLGLSHNARDPKELVEYCLQRALGNSYYKNKILQLKPQGLYHESFDIKIIELKGRPLDEMLLPNAAKEAINLMIEAINKFDELKTPLRYLFSGKPGTGKTETIRSIINTCLGKATFILTGNYSDLRDVFEFASLFSPAVLCLDDVDLVCGDRFSSGGAPQLGELLNLMDGLKSSHIFVLATTNNKKLVDAAASRPGRFDMILDLNMLEPSMYMELIQQRCKNEDVVHMFDESILNELKIKKVSGAFVVNLIKNLDIRYSLSPEIINRDFILTTIQNMYKGFYKFVKEAEPSIGFRTN
jgi:cell division protease FtsH